MGLSAAQPRALESIDISQARSMNSHILEWLDLMAWDIDRGAFV